MMNFLTSPSEPMELKNSEDAIVSPYCEEQGADIILYTNRGLVAVQRKTIEDFVASITDGRLSKEFALMREASNFPILLLEGNFRYTIDDKLRMGGKGSRYTKQSIQKILWSIEYCEGMSICYSDNIKDTIQKVHWLQNWMDKEEHLSLRVRPKFESSWLVPTGEERFIFFLQGLPGISIIRARALAKKFVNPVVLFSASIEEIMEVAGIGQTIATKIYNFLQGEI